MAPGAAHVQPFSCFNRRSFSQLLAGPLCSWVGSQIEVDHATAIMTEY
jgi:hypothetical protein